MWLGRLERDGPKCRIALRWSLATRRSGQKLPANPTLCAFGRTCLFPGALAPDVTLFPFHKVNILRRRAQSDDRRRRILVEESPRKLPEKRATRRAASENASYAPDTLIRQPQLIDFLPRRLWVHPLLWLFALLGMVGLVSLHHWQVGRTDGPWDLFQLQHPASLANWFAVVGLIAIAVLALNIFSLRRFCKSDYHTRYRWWLWVSATAIFSSLAVATAGHRVVAHALATATEWSLPFGDNLFWLVPAGLLFTFLAIRLVLEFRHCRMATIGIAVTWLVFCLRSVMLLGYDFGLPVSWQVSIEGGSTLGMVALIGCGFLWYARYVLLDVEGRLPVRAKRKKVIKASNASNTAVEKNDENPSRPRGRSDLEPDTSRHVAELVDEAGYEAAESEEANSATQRTKESHKRRSNAQNDSVREEISEHRTHEQQRKLSKAERKKFRKLKAKERHAA